MHILIAAHDCYPDPGSGGTGRYVYETARRLVRRGHRTSVITRRRGEVPARETLDGIDLYRYDFTIAERSAPEILAQLPRASTTVARFVGVGKPDIVSYQGPVTSALVNRAVDDSIPRVATLHSPWPTEYRIKTRGPEGSAGVRRQLNIAVRRYVEGNILADADHVITLSRYMRDRLHGVYNRIPDTAVIPGGVDAARFAPDGNTVHGFEGDPTFLTVRRLSQRMGHESLLEAFAVVVERHPEARLYIAGDGPLRAHLERVAREHRVETATSFLGYVPDEDLPAVYRSADAFVLPTQELEGFGLATLEALASGLPVVATPIGGTVELLQDLEVNEAIPGPMLVQSANASAIAAGMCAWADLPAQELEVAARTCREYATTRFTWARAVKYLEELYGNLLSDDEITVVPRSIPPRDRGS